MDVLSFSKDAKYKLAMTGETKYARAFFARTKDEMDNEIKLELSFVDSLFLMFKLRGKIANLKAECRAYDNIRQYNHNFGDYVSYKSINFRWSYLEDIAADKN